MTTAHQTTKFKCDRIPKKQSYIQDEKIVIELLEEYEANLSAGGNPDPHEFLARYPGQDKESFKAELNLVTILQVRSAEIAKQWERLVGPLEVKRIEATICAKLLKRGKRQRQPRTRRRK
jgi:hypothetical protein